MVTPPAALLRTSMPSPGGGGRPGRPDPYALPSGGHANGRFGTVGPVHVPVPRSQKAAQQKGTLAEDGTPLLTPRTFPVPPSFHGQAAPAATEAGAWTPVAASEANNSRTRPPKRPVEDSTHGTPTSSKKKQRKKKPEVENPLPDEPAWEVKRLEGDKIVEIEGVNVRYFKVRWQGNWPPDENPTWEPEDNIDAAAVKKYLKGKQAKGIDTSTPKVTKKAQKAFDPWRNKYSSVSEAFEGLDEDVEPAREDDEDELGDDLRVLDSPNNAAIKEQQVSLDVQLAQQLASLSRLPF